MSPSDCKEKNVDIRVMSYNILNPEYSATGETAESRVEPLYEVITKYMPDVIGVQEVSFYWHDELNNILKDKDTYKFACEKNNILKDNMTTFLYNTKTVKPVDEYLLDLEPNSDIRVFSVARFEKLSDGKQFVVTNTHPAPSGRDNYPTQMNRITELTKEKLEEYKALPFIMTGDFNTKEQSEFYTNFLNDTGVKDARYEAETLIRNYNTFTGFNKKAVEGNEVCIDHIFVNDILLVKSFDVVVDDGVEKVSDHVAIFADLIFNTK